MSTILAVKSLCVRFWIDDDATTPKNRHCLSRWVEFREQFLRDRAVGPYEFFDQYVRAYLTLDSNKTLVQLSRAEGMIGTGDSNQRDKQIRVYPAQWFGINFLFFNPEDSDATAWNEEEIRDLAQAWLKAFNNRMGSGPIIMATVSVLEF